MIVEINKRRFLRRRRIIELQNALPDIRAAIEEACAVEAKAYLIETRDMFEAELAHLLEDERLNP